MNSRPRLLYLAYYFRPAQMIASVRTWNTATHLSRLGWDVQVVTPDPSLWLDKEDSGSVDLSIEENGFSRIVTSHGLRMLVPGDVSYPRNGFSRLIGVIGRRATDILGCDRQIGWARPAEIACAALNSGDIDCILASGPPFVAFRVAKRLADRLNCPYVMDYRDPWNGDPHRLYERPDKPWSIKEERSLLRDCGAVTVVTPSWAKQLDQQYDVGVKTHVISNGYDRTMFGGIKPARFDHFAVVYAGTLYPPKRVLDPVLAAFAKSLKQVSIPMRFHHYGSHGEMIRESARRFGVEEFVELHGQTSRSEALSAQKGANLVVAVTSVEENGAVSDNGMVTGKIFDCLGLDAPVLVVAPRGNDIYSIAEKAGGMRCFTGTDISGIAGYLTACSNGDLPQSRNPDMFQWENIGAQLDAVLRKTISKEKN